MDYNVGWRHSNVSEPDFVPPWEASSRALDLSFELAQNPKDNPGDRNKFARASVSVMRLNEVFLGDEDDLRMCSSTIQHADLCQAECKP